jgi:hypothetical protein
MDDLIEIKFISKILVYIIKLTLKIQKEVQLSKHL